VPLLLDLGSLRMSEATLGRVRHGLSTSDIAEDLARIGLWHDHGVTWELHDYLDYNPSRTQVIHRREREKSRVRQKRCKPVARNTARCCAHPVPVPVPGSGSQISLPSVTQGDATSPRPTELGFDRFWAAYPKKRHKPDAARAWQGVDGARHLEAILAGLERWKAAEAWGRGFVEDPATFLRQRQWEDDPRRPSTPRAPGRVTPTVEATRELLKHL